MSSFTFADNKMGGRMTAACDAIGQGHLNRAAGILAELVDELNQEATQAGLMADDEPVKPAVEAQLPFAPPAPALVVSQPQATDLQSCARGAHNYGAPDPVSGWRECQACGVFNVAPPDGGGHGL